MGEVVFIRMPFSCHSMSGVAVVGEASRWQISLMGKWLWWWWDAGDGVVADSRLAVVASRRTVTELIPESGVLASLVNMFINIIM